MKTKEERQRLHALIVAPFVAIVLIFTSALTASAEVSTVKRSDALSKIAAQYDTTMKRGDTLSVLIVHAAKTYTVVRGDTLSGIAAQHDTTWQHLYKLNRDRIDDPDLIFPGQEFVVAAGSSKVATAPPPPVGSKVRPATGPITSSFGMRTHPITGKYKLHSGTDYGYGNGKVYAALAGKVSVKYPKWAGNLIVINHGDGLVTQYAHLASVSVSTGQRVDAGDVIGQIGERGLATGPHLHFEVLIDGRYVNPEGWLSR